MNPKLKLVLYLGLLTVFISCGQQFMKAARQGGAPVSPGSGTNSVSGTQSVATPTPATTNGQASSIPTNAAATNASATNVPAANEDPTARHASARVGRMISFGIAGFFALIGLSILIGYDVSRFLANRVEEFVFNDDLKGVKDPDYEEAENVWARGDYLGAVQLLRDFYKRHPSEVYAALRIAEIYETNLQNYLAAALEYEEVLKRKLPAERWGWAAIHLSNLYSGKLNKPAQATALLRRIVNEYGQTAAAKKARERLGIPEPMLADLVEAAAEPPPAAPVVRVSPAAKPESNLPPGFRPK